MCELLHTSTVVIAGDSFAVDNAGARAQPGERINDQREATREVITRTAIEPHQRASLTGNDAISCSHWRDWQANRDGVRTRYLSAVIDSSPAAPEDAPWMWTLVYGQHEDRWPTHGYEATRERTATRRRARPRWQRSQGLAAGELGSTAGEGAGSRVAKGARQTTVTREA
jgi:hypothetical protein